MTCGAPLAATLAERADLRHHRLHRQRRAHGLFMPQSIRFGAAEYSEDGVSVDLVHGAVMLEYRIDQCCKIVVEQVHDIVGVHPRGQ